MEQLKIPPLSSAEPLKKKQGKERKGDSANITCQSNTMAKRNAKPKENKHDKTMQAADILAQVSCRSFIAGHYSSPRLQLFH